jgi:hypothetical protein
MMFTVDSHPTPRRKVHCACGHDYYFRVYGRTATKRDETMRWLAGFHCPPCERKAKSEAAKAQQ